MEGEKAPRDIGVATPGVFSPDEAMMYSLESDSGRRYTRATSALRERQETPTLRVRRSAAARLRERRDAALPGQEEVRIYNRKVEIELE